MKLEIRHQNRKTLTRIAELLGDTTLTAALNFVLEKSAQTVLEQIEAMQVEGRSGTNSRRSPASSQRSGTPSQTYVPELDGNAVSSAFD